MIDIHGESFTVDRDQILSFELTIKGIYRLKYQAWERVIAHAASREIKVVLHLTNVLSLAQGEKGVQLFDERKAIKVICKPQPDTGDCL